MSSQQPNKPERARSIFINCPFDVEYRPLFRAMCFTIQLCGYEPRCALDFKDSAQSRFHKIVDLIAECGLSIHDISRVELNGSSGLPRFNMPLELGADLGLRLRGPKKQRDRRVLILEKDPHRYDITASDISGQDIEAHHNSEADIIACVRDWLNVGSSKPLAGAASIQADYKTYLRIVPAIIKAGQLDSFDKLPHNDFLWTVYEAIEAIQNRAGS
jgi:hypothetical protein